MLPIVATLVMGAMSKHLGQAPAAAGSVPDPSSLLGMLTPMLDANHDGSVAGDVVGMVGKFLGEGDQGSRVIRVAG
jgi:hypothetical protein